MPVFKNLEVLVSAAGFMLRIKETRLIGDGLRGRKTSLEVSRLMRKENLLGLEGVIRGVERIGFLQEMDCKSQIAFFS